VTTFSRDYIDSALSTAEQKQLVELLGKLLNEARVPGKPAPSS